MKKIILSVLMFLCVCVAYAQKVNISPSSFTAKDQITIEVDVTGTAVAGIEPLYIWMWSDGGDAPNGNWTSSLESQVMTKVRTNVWSITMIPTEFYKKSAASIGEKIGFLVKAKDGTGDKKTDNLGSPVNKIVEGPQAFRVFPSNFTENDVVTIVYDQKLEENKDFQKITEIFIYTKADVKNAAGNILEWERSFEKGKDWGEVGDTPKLKMKSEGNGIYSLTFVPKLFYALEPKDKILALRVIFRTKTGNLQSSNNKQNVTE
jgi:hypothetical protein